MRHHGGRGGKGAQIGEARVGGGGKTDQWLPIVGDCAGLGYLLADRSGDEFAINDDAICVGLSRVGGLGPVSVARVLEAREDGQFVDLSDFLSRSGLGEAETQSLVLCGAFDWTGRNRPTLGRMAHTWVCPARASDEPSPPVAEGAGGLR